MRSFWIGRRGDWWSVAVAMASGGDGDSRVARGRESGKGERGSRERGGRGGRGRLRGVARESGRLPRRSRRWRPPRARVRAVSVLLAEEEEDKGEEEVAGPREEPGRLG